MSGRINKLPETLRKIIKDRNIKQYELAERIGVSYSSLNRWIRDINEPKLYELIALSDVLNVSIDYLIFGDEENAE